MSQDSPHPEGKKLRSRHVTMITLGGIIGSSLFVGSANVIKAVGPAAVISYLIGGLLVFLAMRMLGEMAAARPAVGSFMEYARVGLGDWAAYFVGVALLVLLGGRDRLRGRGGRLHPERLGARGAAVGLLDPPAPRVHRGEPGVPAVLR
ncbi:hypothetical protein [Arthrobacter woluwensis]|uniref:hypothetical protein n=1 Tax=Arthrobacter woluwensis TaxID=156980 RepID=UPI0027D832D9|nr:hypothetical protein [Arthrobacter woluwensis]